MSADDIYIILLLAVNLVAGFGLAIPLARRFSKINGKPKRFFPYFVIFVAIYFFESAAFSVEKPTAISGGLSFIWGIILGLRLRSCASASDILRGEHQRQKQA